MTTTSSGKRWSKTHVHRKTRRVLNSAKGFLVNRVGNKIHKTNWGCGLNHNSLGRQKDDQDS